MEDDYARIFSTLELDDTVMAADHGETLRLDLTNDSAQTLGVLPLLRMTDADLGGAELQVGKTLGEGGMGVIRAATQAPFGRQVALKTVRNERADDHAVLLSLVREAIAAGRLEHPHIVPIYAIGRDADGSPVIVMKRIDGESWHERFYGPPDGAVDDALEWHLRVFLQVCAAIHFAHRRGVIHRDIKLDNVMIGAHDDVYVVDWGLAMTLLPDPTGQLPDVGQVASVVGTPAYMAPEMAAGGNMALDERTDVYLLGAMLHELLTGKARHHGNDLYSIMLNAYRSEPIHYGPDVPPELGAICNKATSRAADDRFTCAHELRRAVQRYLDHRGAANLTRNAAAQLAELRDAIVDSTTAPDARRIAVYRLYGAARFGFERSIAEWSEQPAAHDGLQQTLELMVDWEISHGSLFAAEALLADLLRPNAELTRRLQQLAAEQSQEKQELESLRARDHELDVNVGQRVRAIQAGLLIVGGMILPMALGFAFGSPDWVTKPLYFFLVAFITCAATMAFMVVAWFWPVGWIRTTRTETNRRISLSVVGICGFLIVFRGTSILLGVPISAQFTMELLTFAMFAGTLAIFVDPRVRGAIVIYALFALAAFLAPDYAVFAFVLGNSAALAWIAWTWRGPSPATPHLTDG